MMKILLRTPGVSLVDITKTKEGENLLKEILQEAEDQRKIRTNSPLQTRQRNDLTALDMSVINIRAKHNIATYDFQLGVEATVQDLSEKIVELTGVPVSGQKIIFCGKQLPKDLSLKLTEVRH